MKQIYIKFNSFFPLQVVCTRKEPLSGWIDHLYGPTGTFTLVAMGIIRSLEGNVRAVVDIVPGDMVISALVTSAWDVHMRKR